MGAALASFAGTIFVSVLLAIDIVDAGFPAYLYYCTYILVLASVTAQPINCSLDTKQPNRSCAPA